MTPAAMANPHARCSCSTSHGMAAVAGYHSALLTSNVPSFCLQTLQLIKHLARRADTCSMLLDAVPNGDASLTVARVLNSAARQSVNRMPALQEAAASSERDALMMKLANALLDTYKVVKVGLALGLAVASNIMLHPSTCPISSCSAHWCLPL